MLWTEVEKQDTGIWRPIPRFRRIVFWDVFAALKGRNLGLTLIHALSTNKLTPEDARGHARAPLVLETRFLTRGEAVTEITEDSE